MSSTIHHTSQYGHITRWNCRSPVNSRLRREKSLEGHFCSELPNYIDGKPTLLERLRRSGRIDRSQNELSAPQIEMEEKVFVERQLKIINQLEQKTRLKYTNVDLGKALENELREMEKYEYYNDSDFSDDGTYESNESDVDYLDKVHNFTDISFDFREIHEGNIEEIEENTRLPKHRRLSYSLPHVLELIE